MKLTYQTAILNFPILSRKYSRWAICLKSPSILTVPAVSVRAMKKFKMISLAWHFSYPGKALIKGSFFEKKSGLEIFGKSLEFLIIKTQS